MKMFLETEYFVLGICRRAYCSHLLLIDFVYHSCMKLALPLAIHLSDHQVSN
jgi:hypothetical protein